MAMKLKDFERLKSLMRSTTSDNDNEALQAIRAANRLLMRDYALTWDAVFARTVVVTTEVEAAPEYHVAKTEEAVELQSAFADAMEGASGGFSEFLSDVYEQWQAKGYLSARQKQVVMDAAARARER
jgi:hypothetical protein